MFWKNLSADYELSPRQCAEVLAYTQMVGEKLAPALEYIWWVDGKNFVEFSRPTYAKCLPFPLNFYYPGKYENHAKELIAALYHEDESAEVIETAVSCSGCWSVLLSMDRLNLVV